MHARIPFRSSLCCFCSLPQFARRPRSDRAPVEPWLDSLTARPDRTPTAPRQSTAVNRQLPTDPTDPDSNINRKPDSQPAHVLSSHVKLSSNGPTTRQPDSPTARQQPDSNLTATLEMAST
eukprot:1660437-Prymnesium_polylepis.1